MGLWMSCGRKRYPRRTKWRPATHKLPTAAQRSPRWRLTNDVPDGYVSPVNPTRNETKRTVTLEIAGARYRMASDADEAHLQRLAASVNARIEALGAKATRTAAPAQLLAVVALSLAEDLEVSERRREELEESTRNVLRQAIARIDSRLAADARVDGATT